ncbi:MAG: serpin family protein, partial [Lachnospiraceae bacterium]|nr:serpin family protein [Lachnospiraceae bacterium]
EDAKMELANSVWFRNTNDRLTVKESFLQTLADWYQAEAYGSAFDENTRKDMDAWVSEHTDGMIKKMLDEPIDPRTMMYLVNALVFDAKWEKQYEKNQVQDRTFTNAKGDKKSVKGLLSDEKVYLEAEGVIGVAKQYKEGGYYFVGLLPADGSESMSDFISGLSGKMWQDLWDNRTNETVKTMIPEFKAEDRTDLKDVLQEMGMERMFGILAEFLPMAEYDGESLYVSSAVQKTYLELDRNGTKAAAVTWGEMGVKSIAPSTMKMVYLDRPFLYMIVDAQSGLPLFIGVQNEM